MVLMLPSVCRFGLGPLIQSWQDNSDGPAEAACRQVVSSQTWSRMTTSVLARPFSSSARGSSHINPFSREALRQVKLSSKAFLRNCKAGMAVESGVIGIGEESFNRAVNFRFSIWKGSRIMSKFRYKSLDVGHEVSHRGKAIGTIVPLKESTGRHCFKLGFDKSRTPRTYRGMDRAAEALLEVTKLAERAKKSKWTTAELIVNAWSAKPAASSPQ